MCFNAFQPLLAWNPDFCSRQYNTTKLRNGSAGNNNINKKKHKRIVIFLALAAENSEMSQIFSILQQQEPLMFCVVVRLNALKLPRSVSYALRHCSSAHHVIGGWTTMVNFAARVFTCLAVSFRSLQLQSTGLDNNVSLLPNLSLLYGVRHAMECFQRIRFMASVTDTSFLLPAKFNAFGQKAQKLASLSHFIPKQSSV